MVSLMAVFWIAVLVLAAWAVATFARRSPGHAAAAPMSPLDIAKQRYARGEITAEEFERLKRDLA